MGQQDEQELVVQEREAAEDQVAQQVPAPPGLREGLLFDCLGALMYGQTPEQSLELQRRLRSALAVEPPREAAQRRLTEDDLYDNPIRQRMLQAFEVRRLQLAEARRCAAVHTARAHALGDAEGALTAIAEDRQPKCLWADQGSCGPSEIYACPACQAWRRVQALRSAASAEARTAQEQPLRERLESLAVQWEGAEGLTLEGLSVEAGQPLTFEELIRAVAVRSGTAYKTDWHYSGGRAQVLTIGDAEAVADALRALWPEFERLWPGSQISIGGPALYRAGDPLPDDVIAVDSTSTMAQAVRP